MELRLKEWKDGELETGASWAGLGSSRKETAHRSDMDGSENGSYLKVLDHQAIPSCHSTDDIPFSLAQK